MGGEWVWQTRVVACLVFLKTAVEFKPHPLEFKQHLLYSLGIGRGAGVAATSQEGGGVSSKENVATRLGAFGMVT